MKKLIVILATLGLMFNVIGCKAKKAQDETEIFENADVEKIEAEDASFAGNEATVESGPVDESLQAALGETPQTDVSATGTEDSLAASTDVVNTDTAVNTDIAATPILDENALGGTDVAAAPTTDAGIVETPVVETPVDTSATEVAQTEAPVDSSLAPETTMDGAVSEMNTAGLSETAITETPVDPAATIETPVAQATTQDVVAAPAASKNRLQKIAETTPYKHGEGFVNTVYIARPKEKLADISRTIYGMDKSKELKAINSFLKSRGPKAGEKIYYISPNRPTDSARTLSFYEDTGMIASTYVAEKGENLNKVAKRLLGYDNAWKEVWTTNPIESKSKLAAGETIRYWRGAEVSTPTTLANLDGKAKLIDSAEQLPPAQQVAQQPPPPPQEEIAPPVAQEMPPPPPPPTEQPAAQEAAPPVAQELPPPPPPEMAPPAPPQEVAQAPAKNHNMEEEPAMEEGAMNSDTMMMMGVVAVLVAALALVLIRRNKKRKEAELASIEQNHVGT